MQNCYKGKNPAASQEVVEDQNGRLTTKHIKTLSFLQEMHNENKFLKNRVEELEVCMFILPIISKIFIILNQTLIQWSGINVYIFVS